jgi:hypothetical protein
VTNACNAWVTIGSRTPAIPASLVDHPATALTTWPVATRPADVRTPTHRPACTSMPVTSTP